MRLILQLQINFMLVKDTAHPFSSADSNGLRYQYYLHTWRGDKGQKLWSY